MSGRATCCAFLVWPTMCSAVVKMAPQSRHRRRRWNRSPFVRHPTTRLFLPPHWGQGSFSRIRSSPCRSRPHRTVPVQACHAGPSPAVSCLTLTRLARPRLPRPTTLRLNLPGPAVHTCLTEPRLAVPDLARARQAGPCLPRRDGRPTHLSRPSRAVPCQACHAVPELSTPYPVQPLLACPALPCRAKPCHACHAALDRRATRWLPSAGLPRVRWRPRRRPLPRTRARAPEAAGTSDGTPASRHRRRSASADDARRR